MQGNPTSPYPNSQGPYGRRRDSSGTYLREDGTPSVEPRGRFKDEDAYIPFVRFRVVEPK